MLEELPESLDETYERVLREINKANRAQAHRLLQCLAVATRPLRVAELAEVLTIDFEAASKGETSKLKTDWRWEDQEQAVLSTCSSLIAVVNENGSQVVQFSHFSVKEFLTSPRLVFIGNRSNYGLYMLTGWCGPPVLSGLNKFYIIAMGAGGCPPLETIKSL